MSSRTFDDELDVREIDGEPFPHIMGALDDLEEGQTFRLIAPFEPVPLYEVLAEKGFEHETEEVGPEEYHVFVEHA